MNEDVNDAPPRRRSRREQQAATRQALVEAAVEVMAEKGVTAATVEMVTARAGFTRGAFYSNFSSKDDLVGAILDTRSADDVADLAPLLAAAAGPTEMIQALRDLPVSAEAMRWRRFVAELRLHALRSPSLRDRVAAWEQEQRAGYRALLAHLFDRAGLDVSADLDLLALAVQVLFDGMALHHEIEGEAVPPEAFLDTLDLLLRALTALAVTPPA